MHKNRHHQKAFAFASRCPDHVKAELKALSRRLEETSEHRKRALLAAERLESWAEIKAMSVRITQK